jgi:MoxR-like ATPase
MDYRKIFDPHDVELFPPVRRGTARERRRRVGDQRDGSVYVYNDEIVLAVNVAIATGRPLLIRGASGSGKSSLAANVARKLGWRYYEIVISSRTQARDLQWTFDTVRRLSDAQTKEGLKSTSAYIQPGVLWWAFDSATAREHGQAQEGTAPTYGAEMDRTPAVVLLDEIDKADPDVPNNLLVPIGSLEFKVSETNTLVRSALRDPPFLCITTNEERDLPPAFVRRCVSIRLADPTRERLVQIAKAHFGKTGVRRYEQIAEQVMNLAGPPDQPGAIRPSSAEYLDAVQASLELRATPVEADPTWQSILQAITSKRAPAVVR